MNDHFRSKYGVSSGVSDDFEIGQIVKVQIYAVSFQSTSSFRALMTMCWQSSLFASEYKPMTCIG